MAKRDSKQLVTARLSADALADLKAEAARRGRTTTELIATAIDEYQHGATGAAIQEAQLAELRAIVEAQDKIIRKHTGKPTPRKKRVTIAIDHATLREYERLARKANMTRGEFMAELLAGESRKLQRQITRIADATAPARAPALPAP